LTAILAGRGVNDAALLRADLADNAARLGTEQTQAIGDQLGRATVLRQVATVSALADSSRTFTLAGQPVENPGDLLAAVGREAGQPHHSEVLTWRGLDVSTRWAPGADRPSLHLAASRTGPSAGQHMPLMLFLDPAWLTGDRHDRIVDFLGYTVDNGERIALSELYAAEQAIGTQPPELNTAPGTPLSQQSMARAAAGVLVIEHTRTRTLLHGVDPEDRALRRLLRDNGFHTSDGSGAWYLDSRANVATRDFRVRNLRQDLEQAGRGFDMHGQDAGGAAELALVQVPIAESFTNPREIQAAARATRQAYYAVTDSKVGERIVEFDNRADGKALAAAGQDITEQALEGSNAAELLDRYVRLFRTATVLHNNLRAEGNRAQKFMTDLADLVQRSGEFAGRLSARLGRSIDTAVPAVPATTPPVDQSSAASRVLPVQDQLTFFSLSDDTEHRGDTSPAAAGDDATTGEAAQPSDAHGSTEATTQPRPQPENPVRDADRADEAAASDGAEAGQDPFEQAIAMARVALAKTAAAGGHNPDAWLDYARFLRTRPETGGDIPANVAGRDTLGEWSIDKATAALGELGYRVEIRQPEGRRKRLERQIEVDSDLRVVVLDAAMPTGTNAFNIVEQVAVLRDAQAVQRDAAGAALVTSPAPRIQNDVDADLRSAPGEQRGTDTATPIPAPADPDLFERAVRSAARALADTSAAGGHNPHAWLDFSELTHTDPDSGIRYAATQVEDYARVGQWWIDQATPALAEFGYRVEVREPEGRKAHRDKQMEVDPDAQLSILDASMTKGNHASNLVIHLAHLRSEAERIAAAHGAAQPLEPVQVSTDDIDADLDLHPISDVDELRHQRITLDNGKMFLAHRIDVDDSGGWLLSGETPDERLELLSSHTYGSTSTPGPSCLRSKRRYCAIGGTRWWARRTSPATTCAITSAGKNAPAPTPGTPS
jgi:hypothetical protein